MTQSSSTDPLHGVTLQTIVETLVEWHGWEDLSERIAVRCFTFEPSVKSSLKFLRKTPWARAQVEALYLTDLRKVERNRKRNLERAERRDKGAVDRVDAQGGEAESSLEPEESSSETIK